MKMTDNEKLGEVMALCSNGNRDAWEYLSIIAKSSRLIDDMVDEHEQWKREDTYRLAQLLLIELPANNFFHQNKAALLSQHVTSLNAWIDSNDWMVEEGARRNYALVIRDQLTELALAVAYLTGGSDNLRKVSLQVRELFLKEEF